MGLASYPSGVLLNIQLSVLFTQASASPLKGIAGQCGSSKDVEMFDCHSEVSHAFGIWWAKDLAKYLTVHGSFP